uniref:Olfactory receptor 1-like n=1 Tax=Astyanax mexicanus TaxID=7994 RepID=A0A3B1IV39_ASTMX
MFQHKSNYCQLFLLDIFNRYFQMAANMTSMQSVSSTNTTFIRPSSFYINGLYNIPHAKYYYVFLCFVYAVTLLGNSFIMGTIYLARSLHTAKYIAVFNLAFSDLCGSSALIPKLLDMFLFENQSISYEACLTNMFFVYFFMTLQSLTLLAMAYDRLIAICFPLRYHAIVTKTTMTLIIGVMWILSMSVNALLVALVTRLSFCRSTTVNSYFCDHGPIYKLACNDNSINSIMGYVCTAALLYIPLILIALSYVCIGFALKKISHGVERIKAMKTCTSHLILVAMFYLPIIGVYTAALTTSLNTNIRIINTALTQTIPPMLNPIIYTLKTEEVSQSIKALYKRSKVNSVMQTAVKNRKGKIPVTS